MGAACGKGGGEGHEAAISGRGDAITGGAKAQAKGLPKLPSNAVKSHPEDYPFIEVRLQRGLVYWVGLKTCFNDEYRRNRFLVCSCSPSSTPIYSERL